MQTFITLAAIIGAALYLKGIFMTTKDEVLAAIDQIGAQLAKAKVEITERIDDLEQAVSNGAEMDEVLSRLGAVRQLAQGLDDIVPDTPETPPEA